MKKLNLLIKIFLLLFLLISTLAIFYNFIFLPYQKDKDFKKCFTGFYSQYSTESKSIDSEAIKKIESLCSIKGSAIVWDNFNVK